jgi:subtilisin family serine protease
MRIELKCREEPVPYDLLDQVVAIRPDGDPSAAESPARILRRLQTERLAKSRDGDFPLTARGRRLFEKAGWIFAEARPQLIEAALTRGNVSDRETAWPVLVDSAGNTMIATDRVSVQLHPDLKEAQAWRRMEEDGLRQVRALKFGKNLFEATLPRGRHFVEAVTELQYGNEYAFAEPVLLQIITGRGNSGDPDFSKQWHHYNDGSDDGKKGADIKSLEAWKTKTGEGIRIAVIDNGIQVNHVDLKDGIVFGGYFKGDGVGKGRFFCYPEHQGFPDHPHGTFCLGMAGARRNNKHGGCGSAPDASLIPIACAADQVGSQATLAEAVAFAADPATKPCGLPREAGADIIACSLGSLTGRWEMCSVLECAIREAAGNGRGGRGVPIFWAVANKSIPIKEDKVCSHPDVIAVGQSSRSDIRAKGAFGPKLEFLAPGMNVFNTTSGNDYTVKEGASYACPLAAGVAALVLSHFPSDWTCCQVRDRLRKTCDRINSEEVEYDVNGHNDRYGFGRINAERALTDPL